MLLSQVIELPTADKFSTGQKVYVDEGGYATFVKNGSHIGYAERPPVNGMLFIQVCGKIPMEGIILEQEGLQVTDSLRELAEAARRINPNVSFDMMCAAIFMAPRIKQIPAKIPYRGRMILINR